ncbi:hypothetical protein ACLI4Z_18155 [Natrialbaceae archaeon A-arb3/5]
MSDHRTSDTDRGLSPVIPVLLVAIITVTGGFVVLGNVSDEHRAGIGITEHDANEELIIGLHSAGNLDLNAAEYGDDGDQPIGIRGCGSDLTADTDDHTLSTVGDTATITLDGNCDAGETVEVVGVMSDGSDGVITTHTVSDDY